MSLSRGEQQGWSPLEAWPTYAGVFLAPFLNFRIDLAFTLSSAFYCLAIAAMLCRSTLPRNPLGPIAWTWFPAAFLIILGLHLSSMVNGDMVRGIVLTVEYAFCLVALPFVLLRADARECYRLLMVFLAGVMVLDLYGIVFFYTVGFDSSSPVVTGNLRLATFIGNPNGTACLNAMVVLILVWLMSERRISKVLGTVYLCISGFALILTSSNTGLIAVAGGVATYVAVTFRLRNSLRLLCLVMLPVAFFSVFGVAALPEAFQKRVLSALVEGDVSEAGTYLHRSDLNWEALDQIEAKRILLLGLGADQFRKISVQEAPVHNVFLILWVEGGILSLIGWVCLLSSGFLLWVRARALGVMFFGRAAVLSAFAVFFIVSNARAHLYLPYWYTAIFLVLGPTIAAVRAAEAVPAGRIRSRRGAIANASPNALRSQV